MIINIPITIHDDLVAQGAIEIYAKRFAGWSKDENKTDEENRQDAIDSCIRFVQEEIKSNYRLVVGDLGAEAGRKLAVDNFDKVLESPDTTNNEGQQ